jgi:hypothetical protein
MIVKNDKSCEFKTPVTMFIEGANYQAERMYSEQEVLELLLKSKIETSNLYYEDIKEWFNQFKKK